MAAMSARLPLVLLALLATHMTACLSTAPVVPETPTNQSQIQACQSTASLHNGVVIGDIVVGVGGSTVGAVAALASDTTTKNDLAITGAILGGIGAAGVAVAGLTAQSFANGHCTDVVGPLPAKRAVSVMPDPISMAH